MQLYDISPGHHTARPPPGLLSPCVTAHVTSIPSSSCPYSPPCLLATAILLARSVSLFAGWLVHFTPHMWGRASGPCPFPRQYNPNTHETFAKPFFSSKQMLFSPEYRVQMFKRFLNSHLQVNGGHACKWDNFTKIAQCHKQMQSVCP